MYPDSDLQLNYETDDAAYFFSTAFDPLNNWSAHTVKLWGCLFPTVEHAYHYRKFDGIAPDIAKQIFESSSPWKAMQIEREHKDKRRTDWEAIKVEIMREIVKAKVQQHDDVKACLLKTGSKKIVENSPWDDFWGIGPNGNGKNTMGKILMEIRDSVNNSKADQP